MALCSGGCGIRTRCLLLAAAGLAAAHALPSSPVVSSPSSMRLRGGQALSSDVLHKGTMAILGAAALPNVLFPERVAGWYGATIEAGDQKLTEALLSFNVGFFVIALLGLMQFLYGGESLAASFGTYMVLNVVTLFAFAIRSKGLLTQTRGPLYVFATLQAACAAIALTGGADSIAVPIIMKGMSVAFGLNSIFGLLKPREFMQAYGFDQLSEAVGVILMLGNGFLLATAAFMYAIASGTAHARSVGLFHGIIALVTAAMMARKDWEKLGMQHGKQLWTAWFLVEALFAYSGLSKA